jgi:predicted membrane chloride channel (bestrophin family)
MKKKFLYGISVLAIAAVAVINITLSNGKTNSLSDLQLANVEALAQESSSSHCNRLCEDWPFTYCVLESSTAYIFCFYKYPR